MKVAKTMADYRNRVVFQRAAPHKASIESMATISAAAQP
jgi:hypothetical protein